MLIYSQSRRFFVLFLGRCYKYQHISFHSLLALPLLHCFIKTLFAVSDWIKTRNTREYSELHPSHCFNLSFSIKERYNPMPLKKDQRKYSDWPNISCRKSKYILEFYFLVILIQKKNISLDIVEAKSTQHTRHFPYLHKISISSFVFQTWLLKTTNILKRVDSRRKCSAGTRIPFWACQGCWALLWRFQPTKKFAGSAARTDRL